MRKRAIYTMAMAKYLTDKGFTAVGTAQNKDDLKKLVWFFERTPELEAACDEYIAVGKAKHNGAKPPVDDWTLAGLFIVGNQPVEAIAKVHGITEERVRAAISKYVNQAKLIAIAALDDKGRQRYMAAKTDNERNAILSERILQGGFLVHNREHTYHIPAGEVSGDA